MKVTHYFNNRFFPSEKAKISPLDIGVLRGYGVFDYVQLYQGKPFHLRDHLDRLKWSVEQVALKLPKTLDEIESLVGQLISLNEPIDAGIRFIITGGLSTGDQLLPVANANFIMIFHPYTPHTDYYYTKGMRLVTNPMLRMLPSVKTTNYMPAIFGMKKAKKWGLMMLYISMKNKNYLKQRQAMHSFLKREY